MQGVRRMDSRVGLKGGAAIEPLPGREYIQRQFSGLLDKGHGVSCLG